MAKLCEICGYRDAMYVCRNCGKEICDECFNHNLWACSICYEKMNVYQDRLQTSNFFNAFFKLFLLGFFMIFLGIILIIISSFISEGKISGGTVFIIGPIPILFGFGPYSSSLIFFAILLMMIILLALFLFSRFK